MDTVRQTFSIPEEKKQKFVALREEILSLEQVPLNMLQRFQGKCVSLTLMVPAAQLLLVFSVTPFKIDQNKK